MSQLTFKKEAAWEKKELYIFNLILEKKNKRYGEDTSAY